MKPPIKLVPLRKRVPYVKRPQIKEILVGLADHVKLTKKELVTHAKRVGDSDAFIRFIESRQYLLGFSKDIMDRYGGLPDPPETIEDELLLSDLEKVLENSGVPYYSRDARELERTYNTLIKKAKPSEPSGKESIKVDDKILNDLRDDCSQITYQIQNLQKELKLREFEMQRLWSAWAVDHLFPNDYLRYKRGQRVRIFKYFKDGRIRGRYRVRVVFLVKGVIMSPDDPIYEVREEETDNIYLIKQAHLNPLGSELKEKGFKKFRAAYNMKIARLGGPKPPPEILLPKSVRKKHLKSVVEKGGEED